tara:strand:- start:11407 stop:12501 length:1095 start_codon:yes stop_codon:yes gene_type:complete
MEGAVAPMVTRNKGEAEPVRASRLKVENGDFISASSVANVVYCKRAGLLAAESKDVNRRDDMPVLDLLPVYELEDIRDSIAQRWRRLLCGLGALIVTATICSSLAAFDSFQYARSTALLLFIVMIALVPFLLSTTSCLNELIRRLRAADLGTRREPDPAATDTTPVFWWDLWKSGFVSQRCDRLADNNWKLDGSPFRVLQRDSWAIPVFRTRSVHDYPKPQHLVRIMAYCHLVESQIGADVPYGIILYGDTMRGIAVPNHPRYRKPFHDALEELRRLVTIADGGGPPPYPGSPDACASCPFGKPRLLSEGKPTLRDGKRLEPHVLVPTNGRKRKYHCDCGDRFEWSPEHQLSKGLKLHDLKRKG